MNKKALFTFVLTASLAGLSAPVLAASPVELTRASYTPATPTPNVENAAMPVGALIPRSMAPLSLLGPNALCDSLQPRKVCAVEVLGDEVGGAEARGPETRQVAQHSPIPISLLIPIAHPVCDPRMTPAECDRSLRGIPPGPLPPLQVPPPISPTPPRFPGPPLSPPSAAVPDLAPQPPVAIDPDVMVKPPRLGDPDIIQPAPNTGSNMPVIVPKPAQ